jgi:crotonobetainyl-CoA:carnitine CoA-transferase CaiB-like acyl-CoA transferase
LDGIRVVDASQMLAGPIAGMRLGDLGADVIKLETPVGGEWTRTHPFANAEIAGETTALLGLNRNKRSLTVDLKKDAGLQTLYRVLETTDVLIQNFRVGTAERLGIGWEQLAERFPHLIYCQISGYGEDGPYSDRPGQDLLLQGLSGSMWSVGSAHDLPTPGPLWAADAMTGYQAVIGIQAALRDRDRTGTGQKVSVDMWSVVMDCQAQEFTTYLNTGLLPTRTEESFAHAWCNPPYGAYPTADGYLLLSQIPIDQLGLAMGDETLSGITSWTEAESRRDEIRRILLGITPTRTTQEWLDLLLPLKIWAGPIYTYEDVANDPHVIARGMIESVEHPTIGELRLPAVPIRFSRSTADIRLAPPLLGANTDEILTEAGVSVDEISELRADGVI